MLSTLCQCDDERKKNFDSKKKDLNTGGPVIGARIGNYIANNLNGHNEPLFSNKYLTWVRNHKICNCSQAQEGWDCFTNNTTAVHKIFNGRTNLGQPVTRSSTL